MLKFCSVVVARCQHTRDTEIHMNGTSPLGSATASASSRPASSPTCDDPSPIGSVKSRDNAASVSADQSSGLLRQLAADVAEYEARTTTFFKSLLSKGKKQTTLSGEGFADDCDGGSNATEPSEGSASNDSQNLHGFESAMEDSFHDDDDGEECSSSNSEVFRSYRTKRMQMILSNTSGAAGSGWDSTALSSDGEGMVPSRGRASDAHSRSSLAVRPSSRQRNTSLPSKKGAQSPSFVSSVASIEVARLKELEEALTKRLPSGSSSPGAVVQQSSTHVECLDRQRLSAVLRVAKDDRTRAVSLATKYSALLDRLGLAQATPSDIQTIVALGALHVVCSRGNTPTLSVTKDHSNLVFIEVRKLPHMPSAESSRKEYGVSLIRCLLYLLESTRFSAQTEVTAGTGQSKVEAPAESIPADQQAVERKQTTSPQQETTAPQIKKVKRVGQRHTTRDFVEAADAFTFLLDVTQCESSQLSALSAVLAQGEELLCAAYPMRIVKIVVYAGNKSVRPDDLPVPRESSANAMVTTSTRQKPLKNPMSVISSFFQKKSITPAEDGTSSTAGGAPHSTKQSFATKLWLSVMLSTWKLRYLRPTVRSRTVMVDSLDGVVNASSLTAFLALKQAPVDVMGLAASDGQALAVCDMTLTQ